ncbi:MULTISPECIES: F0F1 ATP synthase subunit epsilon [Burkholderia]|uniref:ATP synthase epsilon chain n=1 Tax=Burkholderia anthina TaxID=179879 RepID=A0A6P2GER5_9BURK|nr:MULTISPECIES: F0F1 ATP synthase subunit epsilon [Burkholderia]AXK67406.1 F0F1 ATP synthase subunit epsilon [Burkholderia sp. IDO3]MBM2770036.1 F0F1 ATP synthase subunit epsilon [Burkholderia anthina]PCD60038.1 F0F1 ATP synthase subunit epsilon [Burkholderia sp. IDO3]VVU52270.1 ATP synthase F0F1 subunit epsilon [Burkholderia anthina]
MSTVLHLSIATPAGMLVDTPEVVAFRAEDATGSFGVLPGHTDFLTVLSPCVMRWRTADGTRRFCAVSGGVLRIVNGKDIRIACRDGELGDALETLETRVRETRAARLDAARRVRVEQTRLNTQAIRQILKYLRPGTADAAGRADGTNEGGRP